MQQDQDSGDSFAGLGFALGAYTLWGFLPLYLKILDHIPPPEIVAHRILWSLPIAGAVLVLMGRTGDIRVALTSPKMLAMGCVTALLITINWGIYVWAIGAGHTLDASLGYYINPIFSVFLGFVLLKEPLKPLQWGAVALAFAAVCVLTFDAGQLPWTALGLTVSWGFYAFFKKWLEIGPNQGFLLEVLLLSIPALGYVLFLEQAGVGQFSDNIALMVGAGVVTAVPLLLYANGAKRLRLTTIAMLQYVSPTLILLCAVFVFGEPFGPARMIAFPMIWAALVLYSVSIWQGRRR